MRAGRRTGNVDWLDVLAYLILVRAHRIPTGFVLLKRSLLVVPERHDTPIQTHIQGLVYPIEMIKLE